MWEVRSAAVTYCFSNISGVPTMKAEHYRYCVSVMCVIAIAVTCHRVSGDGFNTCFQIFHLTSKQQVLELMTAMIVLTLMGLKHLIEAATLETL